MAEEESNASAQPGPKTTTPDNLAEARYAAKVQFEVEKGRALVQLAAEGWKAYNVFGLAAIRAAMIINGAAAIALLAYLGNSTGKPGLIPWAMLCYLAGVLSATIATGCAFLGLKVVMENLGRPDDDVGKPIPKATVQHENWLIRLVVAAYLTFIVAGILAFLHFTGWVVPGSGCGG